MPSGLFKQENGHWVFSGPTPPSFQGYDQDHNKLLTRYIFQLTPEEQHRVAGSMSKSAPAKKASDKRTTKRDPTSGALRDRQYRGLSNSTARSGGSR